MFKRSNRSQHAVPRTQGTDPHRFRPHVEALEDRELLATFMVINTNNAGIGSLAKAILDANANPGLDAIHFNVGGGGVQTISLTSALDPITEAVTIDATTQPSFAGNPIIELNGTNAGAGAAGLKITAAGTTVKGLVINRFGGAGIRISGATATGNTIVGNYIGTDVTGTLDMGNVGSGVEIADAANNIIGGATVAARNVISGNNNNGILILDGGGTTVQGNFIGTNAAGTADLGNSQSGVLIGGSPNNIIGGTAAGAGNVISGKNQDGITINFLSSTGNVIRGNKIGINAAGTDALGNSDNGVRVIEASGNTIGGTAAGAGNVISGGNLGTGIFIDATSTNTLMQGNFIGTNAAGTAALGNAAGVIILGANNTVGGTAAGARNVISGNTGSGISIGQSTATGNSVLGNFIGTDVTGTADLGNGGGGVDIFNFGDGNTVGGTAAGAGNVISGNDQHGVAILDASDNVVLGNLIGTDVTGTADLGNGTYGVWLLGGFASNNTIGGTAASARNVISSNGGSGVLLVGAADNTVQGNFIGTDVTGTLDLGNALNGILVTASGNLIGGTTGNTIAFNDGAGVLVGSGTGNTISANRIYSNSGLGIDLGNDGVTPNVAGDADVSANDLQNFPGLVTATVGGGNTTITGAFNSKPNTVYKLEFFSNPTVDPTGFGEGRTFLGVTTVTTNADGGINFSVVFFTAVPAGHFVSATATDPLGNTSEFAPNIQVNGPGTLQFSDAAYSVTEDGGSVTVTVTRTDGNLGAITVTAATGNGSAAPGADYTAVAVVLTFADGETSKTFTIPVHSDALVEGTETVQLTLSNPSGGATLGPRGTAALTVADSTTPAVTDVTALVSVLRSKARFHQGSRRFRQVVTLRNVGPQGIYGPLSLVLDNLSRKVKLRNGDGVTLVRPPLGSPCRIVRLGGDNVLSPGESVRVLLTFRSPTLKRIKYATRVLAGVGTP